MNAKERREAELNAANLNIKSGLNALFFCFNA